MTDATSPPSDEELNDAFLEMSSEIRHAEALRTRSQLQAEAQLASDEALFAGLLRDLAERGDVVTLDTSTGRRHRGGIETVGQDYCTVNGVVVALHAVVAVLIPGTPRTASARERPVGARTLAGLLADWSTEQPKVRLWVAGQQVPKGGELHSVATDMVSLVVDGQTIAVPLTAIAEVSSP